MAKTIRLLSTYNGYKPGDIIVVEDAIAAQLLPFNATENLTGGTPAYQPSPGTGLSSGSNLPPSQTLTAGQTTTIVFPAGSALSMQGSSNVSGTYQMLNPDSTVASTTALAAGMFTTGVFLRDTSVKFSVNFGTLDVSASVTGGKVELVDRLAGEDLQFDVQRTRVVARNSIRVLPNKTDVVMGSIGAPGDYLQDVLCVVSSPANSRVVLKEGNPIPKKLILTHSATASTTTQINTAVNPDSVPADFYKDHMVRVGSSPYRKILSHGAFAPNVVNQFTLDMPLPAAPAVNTLVYIENPDFVSELYPIGGSTFSVPVNKNCGGVGWRLSTDTGVSLLVAGDFDNV